MRRGFIGVDLAVTNSNRYRDQHITILKTIWTKSKWTYQDLEGKTVEFKIPARGGIVHGLGKFLVRQNPDGLLAIDAATDIQGKHWAERIFTRYQIPQLGVDRIERHPDQSVAEFLLV